MTDTNRLTTLFGHAVPTLAVGDKVRIVCPTCEGGSSHERSMLFSRDAIRYSWHCFRAQCGESGSVMAGYQVGDDTTALMPKPTRPYTGATYELTQEQIEHIADRYTVWAGDWRTTDDGRFLLPIYDPSRWIRGHVLRRPWWANQGNMDVPKTITYWNEPGPLLAWYRKGNWPPEGKVLIVEDQLSAMRANAVLDITTVALLGTGVNAEKIGEIQSVSRHVVIALDADATGEAFAMARKWGQAFDSCRVHVLSCDIKDMPINDLTNLVI